MICSSLYSVPLLAMKLSSLFNSIQIVTLLDTVFGGTDYKYSWTDKDPVSNEHKDIGAYEEFERKFSQVIRLGFRREAGRHPIVEEDSWKVWQHL